MLDDFTDTYNQVRAAYYHARYAKNFGFELLLIGFGKAFLVHSSEFEYWESFVLDGLQNERKKYGLNSMLTRTDINSLSRAFSIQSKRTDEDPDRYGLHIWGDKYYQKSGFSR